jgi:hypothetical protein
MGAYYYASGQRVELETDDEHVAVDRNAARRAGLEQQVATVPAVAGQSGAVVVTPRSALSAEALATLRKAGAVQPVYRRGRGTLVPLPEVRVEFDNPGQRQAVQKFLAADRTMPRHSVVDDSDDRLVIRPASGRGDDALTIANEIYEHAHPAASSVRFLQFVPKPTLR